MISSATCVDRCERGFLVLDLRLGVVRVRRGQIFVWFYVVWEVFWGLGVDVSNDE